MGSKDKTLGRDPGLTLQDFDRPTAVDSVPEHPGPPQMWLKLQNRDIQLRQGKMVVGRSPDCHIVLDDALVSRRHAAFFCSAEGVVVEDLSSVNGVFVNGMRIHAARSLSPGDRVVVGKHEISVLGSPPSSPAGFDGTETVASSRSETLAKLQTADQAAPPTVDLETEEIEDSSEATHKGDALQLLGGVADKVLALGRGAEAERILTAYLQNTLRAAKATRTVSTDTAPDVARYAVKLAVATGKGSWVDFAIELYTVARKPLPAEIVDELYSVLRRVSAVDLPTLRHYVTVLQADQDRFGPSERFVVQRIEGLERLASLK